MAYSIEKYSKAVNIYIYMCKLEARNFPYPRFCNKKNWMIGLHGFEFCDAEDSLLNVRFSAEEHIDK